LTARNICVGVAALLFLVALLPSAILPHAHVYPLRGVAYLFGAVAYVSELMVLSNLFRHKQPLRHLFMPYVFGFLYLLMGISYLGH
jgi:xanthine/uracil permease